MAWAAVEEAEPFDEIRPWPTLEKTATPQQLDLPAQRARPACGQNSSKRFYPIAAMTALRPRLHR